MINHFAIYISNTDDKRQLIERLISGDIMHEFTKLKGSLFSEITVNKFIEEERRHGHFDVKTKTKNSLQQSSEGECKKAVLVHIISKKPDYIIVDNIFDNLDINAQKNIIEILKGLSLKTIIIQIANRSQDILPFIEYLYKIRYKSLVLIDKTETIKYNETFLKAIPKSKKEHTFEINPLVKLNKVSVSYGDRLILRDITWEIKKGEFWQLTGPNGSGKSTILSLITGDNVKGYNQDITLFGLKKGSGESVWDIKNKIGYFSTEMLRGFSRSDSIGNMIVSGFHDSVGLYKMPSDSEINLTHQWLELLGLFELRKKSFLSLSLGHQRLVLIARAMVKHPPLLILDEPTAGLDDQDAHLFIQLINKISKESDTAILYVSHRNEEGLNPSYIFELIPSEFGSFGKRH